ncbi:helix-turn-helix domain-containing protein [Actinoplanes campanulatus]|uniref:helix-turn-helix domain-containing protein n=1 Tax=Actinoplanes campanulatus TaxID=113559 RepID=UPI00355893FE
MADRRRRQPDWWIPRPAGWTVDHGVPSMSAAGAAAGRRALPTIREHLMAEHIGARVRLWRRRRKTTQAVLAGLAGISQAHLSNIERGERAVEPRSRLGPSDEHLPDRRPGDGTAALRQPARRVRAAHGHRR